MPTVEVIDAAYWMKGCSSLGRLRYAVLLSVIEQTNRATRELCLMDIKEAVDRGGSRLSRGVEMPAMTPSASSKARATSRPFSASE